MIAFKAIHASLIPRKHVIFFTRSLHTTRNSIISLSKKDDSDSNCSSDPENQNPPAEGDTRKQDLLAAIAMIEIEKVKVSEFLDERSAFLTQIAEEANREFDQIGEDAFREIQESGASFMKNLDNKMQAFRESQEMNRLEIEENESKLEQFKAQIEEDKNEGLFFKNLGERMTKPLDKEQVKEDIEKIKEVMKDSAGSKTRRNVYLVLMAVMVAEIADTFISAPDWKKVAVLGAIFVGLFTQFVYEQSLLSEAEKLEKEKNDQKK